MEADQPPEGRRRSYRGLKICCAITALLIVTIAVVLVILYFTVFKPKEPTITPKSATIEHFVAEWPTFFLNVTLGLGITIDNKNYGGFKYENSTASISYREKAVGEAPISADTVPARSKHDIHTSVIIFADKLLFDDPNFIKDFFSGVLNVTSVSTLHGKVVLLNLIKAKATIFSSCDITIYVLPQLVQSVHFDYILCSSLSYCITSYQLFFRGFIISVHCSFYLRTIFIN